jgi:signal transduction histidine kinase
MWVGSHTDIDDQKRREGVLARSIRQRDEFLSAISHDLKTPLTVLRGQAQILQRRIQRGALDKDVMIRGLEQIECRSRTMAKLVDELLDITQLRAGEEFHLDRAMIDLVALVQETVAEGASDRHRLVVQSTERELIGYWDAVHLQRAVENLVNNAIKYSPHGGDITISLATSSAGGDDHALLTVEDHGIGIAADDLPQIFEQFYRGMNAREGTIGTGLGLAGVRRIVEQHDGTIAVTSLEGVGSTFIVRLPLQPVGEP